MEGNVMNYLIAIDEYESSVISGGYDENVANLVEAIAHCVGAIARVIYLLINKKQMYVVEQAVSGYFQKQ